MITRPAGTNARAVASGGLFVKMALTLALVITGCTSTAKRTSKQTNAPTMEPSSEPASESAEATPATDGEAASEPTVIIDALSGPTQFIDGPGDWLLIAQLNGDEDAKTGQVLAIDPGTKQRLVLFDGLDKPTGVAWLNGDVWIMERRQLVRAQWSGAGSETGPIEVMVGDLPFNGRSEGTLTVTPDNRLLYETTGAIEGGKVVAGSGTLWVFDPLTKTSSPVAIGSKNAYAHTFLADGRLATVEIGDNIEDPPVEELNIIPYKGPNGTPAQLGWPECKGDETCTGVVTPLATFPLHTTPTGVTANKQYAYVSLLVAGEIKRVQLNGRATGAAQTTVASGLDGPHTIMLRPNGELWVSEHFADRIVAVTP